MNGPMPPTADIIANYFAPGYRFRKIGPSRDGAETRTAFLIHGWGVRAASMEPLAAALAANGFTVFNYDYPSSRRGIADHAAVFLELYRRTVEQEKIPGKVYFLTHSMGGILLRAAMAEMSAAECRRIAAIVMLGPPNRGSILAHLGRNAVARRLNASLADMTTGRDSYVRNIPAPPFLPPVGIVAGRFDGKVALENTLLPDGQPCCRTVVDCTHPGLRIPRNTLRPVLRFFADGTFG